MSAETPARSASGYSTWRLIAEEIRADIVSGRRADGERLPSEHEFATRFDVSRHTVRRALASLAEAGLVESRRGSGVFVTGTPIHLHRIGMRTRLSTSLGDRHAPVGRVIESVAEPASARVAQQLQLPEGSPTIRVESVRTLEGQPLARGTAWFDAEQLPRIVEELRRTSSVTRALRAHGVEDYIRVSTSISARHATSDEAELLGLDPGSIVLVTESRDAYPNGAPLQYLISRFSAQRVHLAIEHGQATG